MKRKISWMVPMSTLLILIITATMFPVPVAMADSDIGSMSVNINTADSEELASLPGIGSSKADAIINYRSEHGPFITVDELTNIRGIGNNILEKIRDLVSTK